MDMFDLTGRRALVTGSTQGIGFAIAKCLAEHGAEVIIHGGTSEEKCRRAASQIPGAKWALAPLGEGDCAEKLFAATGPVDILVLNASHQIRKSWNEITTEEYDAVVDVNLRSTLLLIQKYVPHMEENHWGRVLCVGSVQEYRPHKDMLMYAATKCGMQSMVRNLAKQWGNNGVTINNLCPGVIDTPRNAGALADPEYSKKVYAGIPLGYAGAPEDCAGAALLFCSEAGRYITGSKLVVDGGMQL